MLNYITNGLQNYPDGIIEGLILQFDSRLPAYLRTDNQRRSLLSYRMTIALA
jgi:hypothetical protein